MKCADVESIVFSATLGEATDVELYQLRTHLAGCESCSRLHAGLGDLVGDLKTELPSAEISPAGRSKMHTAVAREIASSNRLLAIARMSGVIVVSAAVCFCVVMVLQRIVPGRQKVHEAAGVEPSYLPQKVWKVDSITSFHASSAQAPVTCFGEIFTVARNKEQSVIVAVQAVSGKVVWRSTIDTYGYLSADREHVYAVGSNAGGDPELIAMDNTTGEVHWRHRAEGSVESENVNPALADGHDLLWAHGAVVELIAKKSGEKIWRRAFNERRVACTALDTLESVAVVGARAAYRLSNKNELVWMRPFTRPMSSLNQAQVVCGSGMVFVSHREITGCGVLLCLNEKDGGVVWAKSNEESGPMLCADGTLFIRSGVIRAFDAATGEMRWEFRTDGCAPLAYSGRTLYFSESAEKGILVALDARKGSVMQRVSSMGSCAGILITEGLEVVHSISGTLYAFRLWRGDTSSVLPDRSAIVQLPEQTCQPLFASVP